VIEELRRPDGQFGPIGRIIVRTVDRNRCKAKREMIKELLGSINAVNGASRMAEGLQKAMEKKDYDLVDEICQEMKTGVANLKRADKEVQAILEIKRMPRKERRSRIAKVFAKLIFVKNIRPAKS
jgi:flagellar hook-basal body complex protein FliE